MWHFWTLAVGTWSSERTRGFTSLTSSRFFSRHSQTTTTWRRQEVTAAVSVRLSVCPSASELMMTSFTPHVYTSLLFWNDVRRIKLPAVFLSNKQSAVKFLLTADRSPQGSNRFLLRLNIILFVQVKLRTTADY